MSIKNLFFWRSILCISVLCVFSSQFMTSFQPFFARKYGYEGSGKEFCKAIMEDSNGDIVAVGWEDGGPDTAIIMKIAPNGVLVNTWSYIMDYNAATNMYGVKILLNLDGNYLITGYYMYVSGSYKRGILLLKINSTTGEIIFDRQIRATTSLYLIGKKILEYSDGSIGIAGVKESDEKELVIIKVNSTGDTVIHQQHVVGYTFFPSGLFELEDGSTIYVGTKNMYPYTPSSAVALSVVRFNESFGVEYTTSFYDTRFSSSNIAFSPRGCSLAKNGDILIAGVATFPGETRDGAHCLIRLNSSTGSVKWNRVLTVKSESEIIINAAYGVFERAKDDQVIVIGGWSKGTNELGMFMTSFTPEGEFSRFQRAGDYDGLPFNLAFSNPYFTVQQTNPPSDHMLFGGSSFETNKMFLLGKWNTEAPYFCGANNDTISVNVSENYMETHVITVDVDPLIFEHIDLEVYSSCGIKKMAEFTNPVRSEVGICHMCRGKEVGALGDGSNGGCLRGSTCDLENPDELNFTIHTPTWDCICQPHFTGELCGDTTCGGIWSNDSSVCTRHGECVGLDDCECEDGYNVTWDCVFECNGVMYNDSSVCSGEDRGVCVGFNNCSCLYGIGGKNCDSIACGKWTHMDKEVCSGFGNCTSAHLCTCGPLNYRLGPLNVTCVPCEFGMTRSKDNIYLCELCDPGYYSEAENTTGCLPCPIGSFENGNRTCEICSPGSYGGSLAMTACDLCPAGFYNPDTGSTSIVSCIPCPEGTVNPFFGMGNLTACLPCLDPTKCPKGSSGDFTFSPASIFHENLDFELEEVGYDVKVVIMVILLVAGVCFCFCAILPSTLVCYWFQICNLPCCFCTFETLDCCYSMSHDVEEGNSAIKDKTCVGGVCSIIAIVLCGIMISWSIADFTVGNKEVTTFTEFYFFGKDEDLRGDLSFSVLFFGDYPVCNASYDFGGFSYASKKYSLEFDYSRFSSGCQVKFQCQDCTVNNIDQRLEIRLNYENRFTRMIEYSVDFPHFEDGNPYSSSSGEEKEDYNFNGRIVSPLTGTLDDSSVSVSIFLTEMRSLSIATLLTQTFDEKVGETTTGMGANILSINELSKPNLLAMNDPNFLTFTFDMKLSNFKYVVQDHFPQTLLNFLSQLFALIGACVSVVGILFCFFQCFCWTNDGYSCCCWCLDIPHKLFTCKNLKKLFKGWGPGPDEEKKETKIWSKRWIWRSFRNTVGLCLEKTGLRDSGVIEEKVGKGNLGKGFSSSSSDFDDSDSEVNEEMEELESSMDEQQMGVLEDFKIGTNSPTPVEAVQDSTTSNEEEEEDDVLLEEPENEEGSTTDEAFTESNSENSSASSSRSSSNNNQSSMSSQSAVEEEEEHSSEEMLSKEVLFRKNADKEDEEEEEEGGELLISYRRRMEKMMEKQIREMKSLGSRMKYIEEVVKKFTESND